MDTTKQDVMQAIKDNGFGIVYGANSDRPLSIKKPYSNLEVRDLLGRKELEVFTTISEKDWDDFLRTYVPKPKSDEVNSPSHYTSGKIEVIDFIEDQELGFHLGNVVKYVARAGKKDPSKLLQDLEKAEWYLKRKIKKVKNEG